MGAEVEGLDITLAPMRRYVLEGQIIGEGCSAAAIRLTSAWESGGFVRTAHATDSCGFGLKDLPSGNYVLSALAQSGDGTVAAYQTLTIGQDSTGVELMLQPTGVIRGQLVTDSSVPVWLDQLVVAVVLADTGGDADPLRTDEALVRVPGPFEFKNVFGFRNVRIIGLPDGCRVQSVRTGSGSLREPHISIRPSRLRWDLSVQVTCRD